MTFELYGETLAQSSFGVVCGDSATLCALTMSADLLRERGLKALSQASVTLRRGSVIVSVKNVPASLQSDAVSELEKTEFRDEVELAMGCAEKGAWGMHYRGVRFYARLSSADFLALSRRVQDALSGKSRRAVSIDMPEFTDAAGKIVAGVTHRAVRWLAGLSGAAESRSRLSVSFHSPTLPFYALLRDKGMQAALNAIAGQNAPIAKASNVSADTVDQRDRIDAWASNLDLPRPENVLMYAASVPLLLVVGPPSVHDELVEFVRTVVARCPRAADVVLPATQPEHFWVAGEADPPASGQTQVRYISFVAAAIATDLSAKLIDVARRSPSLQCVDVSMASGVTRELVEAMAGSSARFVGVQHAGIAAESLSKEAQLKCCFSTTDVSDRQLAFEAYVRAANEVAGVLFHG
jgi:hypothetical protein